LNRAPYFVEYIQKNLEEILGAAKLYKGGLSIYTTLDLDLQETAQSAVDEGLLTLQARMIKNNIQPAAPQAALLCLDIESGVLVHGGRRTATAQNAILSRISARYGTLTDQRFHAVSRHQRQLSPE